MPVTIYNRLQESTKKSIKRFIFSLFIAWGAAVFINDIPVVLHYFQQFGIDDFIGKSLINSTNELLKISGFQTFLTGDFLKIEGTNGVIVEYGCMGIRHLTLFVVFISLYFGRILHKLWFIPLGCLLLFLANVLRIYIVCVTQYFSPNKFNLAHEAGSFVFQWFAILILWIIWMNKFGKVEHKTQG